MHGLRGPSLKGELFMHLHNRIKDFQNSFFWRAARQINSILLMIFAIGVTGVIFAAVACRYVLQYDLYGNDELILIIAWWLYFIGGMNGSMEDSQIKAEMVDIFVKNHNLLVRLKALAKLVEGVIFSVSAVLSFNLVLLNLDRMPRTVALKIPLIVAQIPIAIGFAGMAFFACYYALFFITDTEGNGEMK